MGRLRGSLLRAQRELRAASVGFWAGLGAGGGHSVNEGRQHRLALCN